MLELKACPRCEGDIIKTQDTYGPYLDCLQCGYTSDISEKRTPPGRRSILRSLKAIRAKLGGRRALARQR